MPWPNCPAPVSLLPMTSMFFSLNSNLPTPTTKYSLLLYLQLQSSPHFPCKYPSFPAQLSLLIFQAFPKALFWSYLPHSWYFYFPPASNSSLSFMIFIWESNPITTTRLEPKFLMFLIMPCTRQTYSSSRPPEQSKEISLPPTSALGSRVAPFNREKYIWESLDLSKAPWRERSSANHRFFILIFLFLFHFYLFSSFFSFFFFFFLFLCAFSLFSESLAAKP